ncbi:sphingosine 1-phosphate receptor 1-like [Actinia tenebrosa]|uniref:Sphingosine 1-phosphate receptor 1-like n=1 Tax=Actinia tenebrosa TaxID=6105 RepID=A0A6P8I076_ACTTE|nr:sphingosine 1-phosphate receptor 1-like [Actinia tenebrosa]
MGDIQDETCAFERSQYDNPNHPLVMSTMYSTAALVTTVLNFLILISIWKTPSLHKPSYILIGSLALSDFLVGAIGEPLMVILNIAALKGWSNNIFCLVLKCTTCVVFAFSAISLVTLTFISMDRLLAVKLRNRYQCVVTKKRVFYALLTVWIISWVLPATLFDKLSSNDTAFLPLVLFVGILALVLVVTITISYSMAFYSLRKITSSSVSPSVQNSEAGARPSCNIDVAKYKKSLTTMFVVFIFTILFYAPFICTLLAFAVTADQQLSSLLSLDVTYMGVLASELIGLLNSAMNPLLYLWRIRDIREAVKTTVKTVFKIF